jgi:hypothetical protein
MRIGTEGHPSLVDWSEPTSYERLWLMFVMHEKYGKIWNGEEWVKA